LFFSRKETATEVVIRDDTMVTVTSPQFKSSMEIASPTEQDFEVIKAAGKLMFRQKTEQK
jgi:hypothetical protein